MTTSALEERYRDRYTKCLVPLASRLQAYVADALEGLPRIDQVVVRAKSIDRFVEKAVKIEDSVQKYDDPLKQIQDQVGARIVTYYLDDVEVVSRRVDELFARVEAKHVVPDRDSEFGYFGVHRILFIPRDLVGADEFDAPSFFELQIKTLYQHAWGQANHDLGYKPESDLDSKFKRKIAFTSAQSWGADEMFSELYRAAHAN